MRTSTLALSSLALVLTGCAAGGVARVHVPLVIEASGDELTRARTETERASSQLAIELAEAPMPTAPPTRRIEAIEFASVRRAYDDGELEVCLAALPSPERIEESLREGDLMTPSRAIFWRMACLRALGREDEARMAAAEHASRALPLPDDLGAANAIAETMLHDAHRAAAASGRVGVAIETTPPGARVSIDGAPRAEITPTAPLLLPGRHFVRVSLPTFASRDVSIDVIEGQPLAPIAIALTRSEPEAAARALEARREEGRALDDDVSLSLLVVSLRSRALVLVSRDADRTRAALVTLDDDALAGTVVRAERVGREQWDLRGLLEDVLVRGSLLAPPPEFHERPELWIGIAGAVIIGAGIALGVAIEPDVRTRITW
jgi:hypothetical protein